MASDLIGLMMARYLVGAEPLASLPPDAVVACIAPVLQRDLAGPIRPEFSSPIKKTSRVATAAGCPGPDAKEGAER